MKRKLALAAFLISVLISASACSKKTPAPRPAKKPSVASFLAYYKLDAKTGNLQIMRADENGGNPSMLVDIPNPGKYSLYDIGPGVSVMARDPISGILFYSYENEIHSLNLLNKSDRLLAAHNMLPPKSGARPLGAQRLWLSSKRGALLALFVIPPTEKESGKSEYIHIDTASGKVKGITPADKEWDDFDFYNKLDFCFLDCGEKSYPDAANALSFKLAPPKKNGARQWPTLDVSGKDGAETSVTDGSARVIAARWSASGSYLVFITAESCGLGGKCPGKLFTFNIKDKTTSEISKSPVPAETIFNVSRKRDLLFYGDSGGVYKYDFTPSPKSAGPAGAYPVLFEIP